MKKSLLKKIVSCALVSSMAFAVAACSESADETVANNEDAQETVTEETEAVEETTAEETVAETEVTFEGTEITETVDVNGWSSMFLSLFLTVQITNSYQRILQRVGI